ncbi:MAG: DUF805 domain-containing protein [Flavobacterium sp.]
MTNYTKNYKSTYVKPESDYNMFDWAKKSHIDNFANFNGRARRSEYWYTVLADFIIQISVIIFAVILVLLSPELYPVSIFLYIIVVLYSLVVFIPGLAMTVRRLHDIGKSGTYLFFYFIPIAGPIILIIFLATDSEPGENKWGPNPKNIINKEIDLIGKE